MLKIEGIVVNPLHIQKRVIYIPPQSRGDRNHKDCSIGRLVGFNKNNANVLFEGGKLPIFMPPEHLVWDEKPK